MSAETKADLIRALTAHLHDEDEASPIVTGLLMVASVAGMSETTGYRFEVLTDDQPSHVTRGLLSLVQEWALDCTSLHMWDADDDD